MWAYHEATKSSTLSVEDCRRECQIIDYARRRTGNEFLDTGSTPVYSITCNASEGGIAYADAFERSSTFHAAASFFVLRRDPFTGGFLNAYLRNAENARFC